MHPTNATSRFSDRVGNYVRYRPGYPLEVIETLKSQCSLRPGNVVADIASGTGIWTHMLLEHGNAVLGVEPNAEMREAGENLLAGFPNFTSVGGSAEATTLPDHSVDFVTAAQAAHWFNRDLARREFARILKRGGWLVLLWNERRTDSTLFLQAYEQLLLTYGTDYQEVRHENTTAAVHEFLTRLSSGNRSLPCSRSLTMRGSKADRCRHRTRRARTILATLPCCNSCDISLTHIKPAAKSHSNTTRACISDS